MNALKKQKKKMQFMFAFMLILIAGILIGCSSESKKEEAMLSAQQLLSEQNYAEAMTAYEEVIAMDAQATDAYIGLAKTHIANGDYEQAYSVLEQGMNAGMPLENVELPDIDDSEVDKLYVSVLAMCAAETTDPQKAVDCYAQIDTATAVYPYTAEQLNTLAKSALEQEDGLLAVLGFCNEKMLANPELEMDAEIASDMIMDAIEDKITYTEDDYYLVNDWFIANMKHSDAIEKFLEKKMNFKYPTPTNTDFNAQADEFIAQYGGDYLIRHFFLHDTGEIQALNYADGDYGVYNDKGMIIFDSATDIQDWNQDGLNDVSFFYDEQDRLIKIESSYVDYLFGDVIPVCREFVYNEAGQLTKVIDGGNTYISIKYDSQGRAVEMKESDWDTTTYQYDDVNGVMYYKSVNSWDGTVSEWDEDISLYDAPVKYDVYAFLTQGGTARVEPINERVLSDGTIIHCSDGNGADFYAPGEYVFSDYVSRCFDLDQTLQGTYDADVGYEIHVEQAIEPAEDCINPHLAGKKYWAEDEYGIMEVVYDEYGLCDYTRSEYKDGGKVTTYFVIYLKKYNEDGSIYSCPVKIITGGEYSYADSQYTNAFSGYAYNEYYR